MKIVLIGAGSYVFAPSVLHDAIVDHRVEGELVMVDVVGELAELMAGVGCAMARDRRVAVDVTATSDREEALPNADAVIFAAAVQGASRWRTDYEIVYRHGMPDQARECGGLGGLGYSLRTVSLALDVAADMERLCPNALFLDCANPLPRVVGAVAYHTSLRAFGFCNMAWGGADGYRQIGAWVGRDPSELEVVTAGLNHFAWVLQVRDRATGEDLLPVARQRVARAETEQDAVLARWLDEYGALGASGVGHMGEYLPRQDGVYYQSRPPFHGDVAERQANLDRLGEIAAGRRDWRDTLERRSWERPVDVAVAVHRRVEARFDMLNLPNDGAIAELPDGRIVETPVVAERGEVKAVSVPPLPEGVAAICRQLSDVHELVGESAATGDRDLARQAVEIDPAITDKQAGLAALEEIIDAHLDILPRFDSERSPS